MVRRLPTASGDGGEGPRTSARVVQVTMGTRTKGLTFRVGAVSAIFAAVLAGAFALLGVSANASRADQAAATSALRVGLASRSLEASILAMQGGLSAYLFEGPGTSLAPYLAAKNAADDEARSLEGLARSSRTERPVARTIAAGVDAYISRWADPLVGEANRNIGAAQRTYAGDVGARVSILEAELARLTGMAGTIARRDRRNASSRDADTLALAVGALVLCALLVVVVVLRVRRRVLTPLRHLVDAAALLGAGEHAVRIPPGGIAEIADLTGAFNAMAARLDDAAARIEDQRAEAESLQRFTDALGTAGDAALDGASALSALVAVANADAGFVYLEDAHGQLRLAAQHAGSRVIGSLPDSTDAWRAVDERHVVQCAAGEPAPGGKGPEREWAQHIPLVLGDRVVGLVTLVRAQPFDDALTERLDARCQRMAVACAVALSHARTEALARELDAVLETTDEGIYRIDTRGRVTAANRAALALLGYTATEFVGTHVHRLTHHTRSDGSPFPAEECPTAGTLREGRGVRVTGDLLWRKDRTPIISEYSSYPLLDGERITGAVVSFADITERISNERRLRAEHAVAQRLAAHDSLREAMPDVLKALGAALHWHVAILWARRGEDATLEPAASFVVSGYETDEALLVAAERSGASRIVRRAQWEGGLHAAAADHIAPARAAAGDHPGVQRVAAFRLPDPEFDLGVIEFLTPGPIAEAGLEDTLSAVAAQLVQHREHQRIEHETERAKEQFVASVSHELRTPLTAIDGWLHILLGEEPGPLTDEQRRALDTVKRNSERLIGLVGELLLAGEIEAGTFHVELSEVDLSGLVAEVVELLGPMARSQGVRLVAGPVDPVIIAGDRGRLIQLLNNLVTNAIKFSPDGGDVVLRLVCGVQQCRLEVSDEGVGIPLAERGRLFRRFSRASSAAGIGGTGLGLAISMSIAEAHDGTIEVADRRGPGTTFVVTLPLRSDASKSAGEAHPGAASRRPAPPAIGPERRLLAVEELAP